jgi:site-specific recombinase XerD
LLFVSGLRVSEALTLTGRQNDANTGTVRVRTLKQRSGAPERVLPLPGDVVTGLSLLQKKGSKERLFAWSRQHAHALVREALQRIGIEGERSHPRALRHSFAVHALQAGVTLNALQQLMGHRFLSSTAIYLRLTGKDVERQYHAVAW